jgi:hypothetical protein
MVKQKNTAYPTYYDPEIKIIRKRRKMRAYIKKSISIFLFKKLCQEIIQDFQLIDQW